MTDISILIVTHNHEEFIGSLLSSLETQGYKKVYFCEAASTDATPEIIGNSIYQDNILYKKQLEGFSKNNNDLIRHFKLNSNWYLLLNPDTFFDTDFLTALLNRAKGEKDIGIVSPLIKYPDGSIQKTWKRFPGIKTVVLKRLGFLEAKNELQMQGPNIDWALGACMLINSTLVKSGGMLLDERYRLYCEDIDICFEAKHRKLMVLGIEEAVVYHHLNEKSAKNIFSKYNRWNIASIIKFAIKWNFKYLFR